MARIRALAAIAAVALVAAGCGSSSDDTKTTSGSAPATGGGKLSNLVPESVKKEGKIVVATDASYPPFELYGPDNKTIVGLDPDLGKELGKVLGVEFEFKATGFDSIIPGLAAGRFGLGMSSMTVNAQRAKVVDFVSYFSAGTSIVSLADKFTDIASSGDALCGLKVGVLKGTSQEDPDLTGRQKACKAAGKPAIKALIYPTQSEVNLAVSSGHADVALEDSPTAVYASKHSNGKLAARGAVYDTAPMGVAVPKDAGTLKDAVKAAMDELMRNGTYKKLLTKWDLQDGAVPASEINPLQ